ILLSVVITSLHFVFSSRRRHTISKRDWSSDVCSSDLFKRRRVYITQSNKFRSISVPFERLKMLTRNTPTPNKCKTNLSVINNIRSEERRVGKSGKHSDCRKSKKNKIM